MGLGGWAYHLYVDSRPKLDEMVARLVPYIVSLNIPFYFNRYSETGSTYLQVGFLSENDSPDYVKPLKEKIDLVLQKAKREFSAKVEFATPDFRVIDGIIIDEIKMLSTKTAVAFLKNPTAMQLRLFIHFLMNQLGFSYEDEIDVYAELLHSISERRGYKTKIEVGGRIERDDE